MKRFLFVLLIILTVSSSFLFSQKGKKDKNVVFRISPLAAGVEFRIKGNFTLYNDIRIGVNIVSEDGEGNIEIPLYIQVNPRFYYNIQKRKSQGKRIEKFSGNYVAIIFKKGLVYLGDNDNKPGGALAPAWGLQRNIGKSGYFNLCIGYGVNFEEGKVRPGLQAMFGIGFAF